VIPLSGILILHSLSASSSKSRVPAIGNIINYFKVFLALVFASGIVAWWLVLTTESRRVAQEESNRQTGLLLREIELHGQTDAELQLARYLAEQANNAKSRYITGISHELRTPLNSILGYAQLLDNDKNIPKNNQKT
jgi:signal transduction histidine kinase